MAAAGEVAKRSIISADGVHHTNSWWTFNPSADLSTRRSARAPVRYNGEFAEFHRLPLRSKIPQGIVVLPAVTEDRLIGGRERRWLAKARLSMLPAGEEPLRRVMASLQLAAPDHALAALRWRGQTGHTPDGWICAADPVCLQARMNHLRMFEPDELAEPDFDALLEHLRNRLSSRNLQFCRIGALGYLQSTETMATAAVSATVAAGASPDVFLPVGADAAPHDRLQSEVQMCLHDADFNDRRETSGKLPVNSLWFWGGGIAPRPEAVALPTLYADDPLFRGYWQAAGAETLPWPGSLAECIESSPASFVAVVPVARDEAADFVTHLSDLRRSASRRRMLRLALLFRDGLRAELRRGDGLRFWRTDSPLLGSRTPGDES